MHHSEDAYGVAIYPEVHDVRKGANESTSGFAAHPRIRPWHLGDPVERTEDGHEKTIAETDSLPVMPERRLNKVGLDAFLKSDAVSHGAP